MHVAIFLDQHPHSLGGALSSALLQKKYLERQGHMVTICAPRVINGVKEPSYILFPSIPVTLNGEYACSLAFGRASAFINQEFGRIKKPVDVVHIQSDLWSTVLGVEFAKRRQIPIVFTVHANLDVIVKSAVGARAGNILIRFMSAALNRRVGDSGVKVGGDCWKYLRQVASYADRVVSPSHHFAKLLRQYDVAESIDVIQTGVDDDEIDKLLARKSSRKSDDPRVKFVWSGRMSREKRLMEFLRAYRLSGVDATVDIYGEGVHKARASRFISRNNLNSRVHIHNKVTHAEMLRTFRDADALIQTSIGFETQGMTVFEAISVGTPVIVSDKNIADELHDGGYWLVGDESVESLAGAIRRAYDDILKGSGEAGGFVSAYDFRQSKITASTIAMYKDVIKKAVL